VQAREQRLAIRTYQEVAAILAARGQRITWAGVRWIELRALARLRGKLRQEQPLCD